MIELSTQMPQAVSPVSGPAAPGGAAGGFLRLLATYLDAASGGVPATTTDVALPADRQEIAGNGTDLPEATDNGDKMIDPRLIWLPVDLQPQQPIIAPVPPAAAEAAAALLAPSSGLAPQTALLPSLDPLVLSGAIGDQTPAKDGVSANQDLTVPVQVAGGRDEAAQAATKRLVALLQPVAETPAARPAGQAFAAAIAAAATGHERSVREQDHLVPGGADGIVAMAQADVARPIVHAVADAKQAALDLRDDHGLNRMIDRIEMLRDEADSRDTRIRLVPDALGSVDVSLRKDGDTLHVHFTAETQATRTLLVEAQPRLSELAEARGVKLGQTSVDAGANGNAHHTHHQARPDMPRAPVSAATPAAAAITTDQRLA